MGREECWLGRLVRARLYTPAVRAELTHGPGGDGDALRASLAPMLGKRLRGERCPALLRPRPASPHSSAGFWTQEYEREAGVAQRAHPRGRGGLLLLPQAGMCCTRGCTNTRQHGRTPATQGYESTPRHPAPPHSYRVPVPGLEDSPPHAQDPEHIPKPAALRAEILSHPIQHPGPRPTLSPWPSPPAACANDAARSAPVLKHESHRTTNTNTHGTHDAPPPDVRR